MDNSNIEKSSVFIPDPQYEPSFEKTNKIISNLSVIDLNENEEDEWDFFSSTQNLSTVLNDPKISRTVSDQIFTKDWGSYFNDTGQIFIYKNINKSNKTDFIDQYIYDLNKRINYKKKMLELEKNKNNLNKDTNYMIIKEPINLDKLIPIIFLKEDFDLENLNTFKEIFMNKKNDFFINDTSLKSNDSIQESINYLEKNLTDYLDVVEEHLAKQISNRFREFFHIMDAMDSIMDQLSTTIKEVTSVRKNCLKLQETLVYPSLKNIQLTQKKVNLQTLYEKVRIMAAVHDTQPTIQNFLSNSDYVGALDLINTTQDVFELDLKGLNCFRYLNSQLIEIKNLIDQMMQEDFIKFITCFLNRPFEKNELNLDLNDEFCYFDQNKLSSIILGMLKLERFSFFQIFKDEACTTIKASVKQIIIEILANEDSIDLDNNNSTYNQLSELDFSKWVNLLSEIFNNLYIILKRIQRIYAVINKIIKFGKDIIKNLSSEIELNSIKQDEEIKKNNYNNDEDNLNEKLKNCLYLICDFCNQHCSEIIDSRVQDIVINRVSFDEFVDLIKVINSFTDRCESICKLRNTKLKTVLQAQINKYVTKFHDEKKKNILSLLEIEQWRPFESVNLDFQNMINNLINYNVPLNQLQNEFKSHPSNNKKNNKPQKYLIVNDQKFVIVSTLITFINTIIEYCSTAAEIKFLTADLLTRLFDLFKQFNSKIAKLVLLAEACHVSGLKTITSLNLIVCNRCLTLILILLPYVKNHFTLLIPIKQKSMLKHFDSIKEIYANHIQKTIEKVIEVVNEVLIVNVNKWEAKPPVPSPQFKAICQDLQRLYLIIEETLPEEESNSLLLQIHNSFVNLLKNQLIKLKITNDGGPSHGLVTQELTFYKESLKFFKNANFSWNNLWTKN